MRQQILSAGINGSGKHCSWGLTTDTGRNLYGRRAAGFVALVSVLANAVDVHGDTLRVSIGHVRDDPRLRAQEAPPAIISLETGPELVNTT